MKKDLKNISLFILIIISIVSLNYPIQAEEALYSITIDGTPVDFNDYMGHPMLTKTQRTLVPIRIISENMGYKVDWSKDTWDKGIRKVWISNVDTKVELELNKSTALVNGKEVHIDIQNGQPVDTKAILLGSRTYVPIRFISEALGAKVGFEWKDGIHYISINTGKEQDKEQIIGNIKFNPKKDLMEDGRMTEEKSLEYLDEMVKNVKVYKENGKYYLKYNHVELPENFVNGVGFETNFNRVTTDAPLCLTTGKAYFKENQLPAKQSFVKELDSKKMSDVSFYTLQLTVASTNHTNKSGDCTSAKYYIRYYPSQNKCEIVRYNKWGSPIETKPFDKNIIFGKGL